LRLKCTKTHLRAYKGPKNFFRFAIARHQGEGKGRGKGGAKGGEGKGKGRGGEGKGEGRGKGRGGEEGREGEGRGGEREDTAPPIQIPGYAAAAVTSIR
jgi:hypothetical protein